jgi:hypothetical protein
MCSSISAKLVFLRAAVGHREVRIGSGLGWEFLASAYALSGIYLEGWTSRAG